MAETAAPVDANGNPIEPAVVVPPVVPEAPKPPTYDEKQQKHFNDTINEAYGKAFDKASGLFAPQIKELNDKIAALTAAKPAAPVVVVAEPPVVPKSVAESAEIARLNAQLTEVRTIADKLKADKDEAETRNVTASARARTPRSRKSSSGRPTRSTSSTAWMSST